MDFFGQILQGMLVMFGIALCILVAIYFWPMMIVGFVFLFTGGMIYRGMIQEYDSEA